MVFERVSAQWVSFFNLLEFWLGTFVFAKLIKAGRFWGHDDYEPDVLVDFKRGSVVFQSFWEEEFSHHTIELLSPLGRLMYEKGGNSIKWHSITTNSQKPDVKTLNAKSELIENSMKRYQWHVADQISRYFSNDSQHLCTGLQALATLEAMEYIISLRKK